MRLKIFLLAALAALAVPAHAEVAEQSDFGFVVMHQAQIAAAPDAVYKQLVAPADWWNPEHSWTGDSRNLYMDAQAGGCFCELIRDGAQTRDSRPRGSVQHMRVLYADPGKVLRLSGALGPLQSEAVAGTLTFALQSKDGGTELSVSYVVGGYMRYKISDIAPAVDGVIGDQVERLKAKAADAATADPSAEQP